jgi:hypothetical protein
VPLKISAGSHAVYIGGAARAPDESHEASLVRLGAPRADNTRAREGVTRVAAGAQVGWFSLASQAARIRCAPGGAGLCTKNYNGVLSS